MEQCRASHPQLSYTWRHILLPFRSRHLFFLAYIHIQPKSPDLLEMAHLAYRRHGNFPQRRVALLPLALEAMPSETGLNPASTAEEPSLTEHLCSAGFCEMEQETNWSCNGQTRAASPSSEKPLRPPGKDVAALLKKISIHPEAQRILGNSCIPVVSLKRLNFQSVLLSSSLQPVVSLVRLPCQTQAKLHRDVSHPQQNDFRQNEENTLQMREASPQCNPADLSQPGSTQMSWTEPYCPDSSSTGEPEQDSGFDCESNPDQPYILFESGSDEWEPDGKTDSETFYLDPDPEQTMVIELDPEPQADQDQSLELEDESETKCEGDVVQMDNSDDQRPDLCCSQQEVDSSIQQPEPGPETEEMESEDFCAVCLNGGDLLCCDRCPKVYHLACHIPPLICSPLGDWMCTLCRTDQEPAENYDCENMYSCGGVKAPYTLSDQDQRRCEKLTLLLYCHTLSAPFHEPVSPLAQNYYQIIKRPINLSVIRRKLDESNTLHYFNAEQFVDDVLLMFKNCATFNYPDSEVAQAGRNLEVFFLSKLKEVFPDRTFPSASQDTMDRARLCWLSRKRKESHRKKRYVFGGKKYYL
ncbi:E3 ubiquitin-protein ligase TRIM33-like [Chaetodon trifascialis]|uniref:E3 ubiquitin-protein ligase TRIM33-like n=1 Tax=Chaetodon trifascialis TaxID=109706 RepID=UPI003995B76F